MRKNIFLAILAIFLVPPVIGQDIDFAKNIIHEITSPAYHGRGYTFNGDKLTADYIARQLEASGVQKIKNNTYFQEFSLTVNTFPKHAAISIDGTKLIPGIDYLVSPVSSSLKGEFPIFKLDSLALAQHGIEKILNLNLEGFFLLLDTTGLSDKAVADKLVFMANRNMLRASGIVKLKQSLMYGKTSFQYPFPVIEIMENAFPEEASTIKVHVKNKLIENYVTRNVIGFIKGKTDSFLVVTAHYDHLGRMGKNVYFPGANDNASGVAMALDMARHYSATAEKPDYNLVFIFFGAEETGLVGSKYFVEHPLFDLDKIKFLINLDLVGTGRDGITIVNGSVHQEMFDRFTAINERNNYLEAVKIRGAAANSDHHFFHEAGVPCFFIYAQGKDTYYHHVQDKAETLPLTGYENIYRIITDFFESLAHE